MKTFIKFLIPFACSLNFVVGLSMILLSLESEDITAYVGGIMLSSTGLCGLVVHILSSIETHHTIDASEIKGREINTRGDDFYHNNI